MKLYFKNSLYVGLILIALLNFAYANESETYEDKICKKLANISISNQDLPTSRDRNELVGCNSSDLYYGISTPANYTKARKCALIEWLDNPQSESVTSPLGSSDILMMIYANGYNVKRSPDIATHIACLTQDTPYTNSNISIKYLQNLKTIYSTHKFDVCTGDSAGVDTVGENNDPNSLNSSVYACATKDADFKYGKSIQSFAKYKVNFNQTQQDLFTSLLQSSKEFFDSSSSYEDHINCEVSNTSAQANSENISDYEKVIDLKIDLITSLMQFEQGKYPSSVSLNQYKEAQKNLKLENNKIKQFYSKNKTALSNASVSIVDYEKETDTQNLWFTYKNQFVKFAVNRYSKVPSYQWETWLINKRIKELSDHLGNLQFLVESGCT